MKVNKKKYTTPVVISKKIRRYLTGSLLAASTAVSGETAPWGAKGNFGSFEEESMDYEEYGVMSLY